MGNILLTKLFFVTSEVAARDGITGMTGILSFKSVWHRF